MHTVEEEVDKILDCIEEKGYKVYLVRFSNIDIGFDQWIPDKLLLNCPNKIKEYEKRKNQEEQVIIQKEQNKRRRYEPPPRSLTHPPISEIFSTRVDLLTKRYHQRFTTKLSSI
jgi:Chromo (CHRromatin Organisation MOdifier) domain